MGLEAATYISDLVSTNPVGASDQKSQGDDHIRLLKSTIKASFPNITGAMSLTHTYLNALAPFASDPGADRIMFWDDGAGAFAFLAPDGTTVAISGTTLSAGANVPLLNAANTFTATQTISGAASPQVTVTDTTTPVTARLSASDSYGLAGTSTAHPFYLQTAGVDRVFIAGDGSEFQVDATLLDFNGAADFSGSLTTNGGVVELFGAAQSNLYLIDSGAAADTKRWRTVVDDGNLTWSTRTDANAAGSTFFNVNRTGTTVNTLLLAATTLDLNGACNIAGGLNAEPESRDITDTGNTAATDQGIIIRMTSGASKTFTLDGEPPTDATVILDNSSGNAWTIAASGTLIWASNASTGSRTLADDGLAVAVHRGSGVWIINGGGLS